MAWVLVWLQLTAQGIQYYQIGTYELEIDCGNELKKAVVMITSDREMIRCIHIGKKEDG